MKRTDVLLEAMSIFRNEWEDKLHLESSEKEAKSLQDKFIVLFGRVAKEARAGKAKAAGDRI